MSGMLSPRHKRFERLYRGSVLDEARRWRERATPSETESAFLEASSAEHQLQEAAELVQLDKQNRVKLNPLMMEICEIRQQVVIVGNMHYLQLFDVDAWKTMFKAGLSQMGRAMETAAETDLLLAAMILFNLALFASNQFIINTAEIEKSAQRQEQDSTERQGL